MNREPTAPLREQPAPVLQVEPPFVWPEPRWLARQGRYEPTPPFEPLLAQAELLAGVLVGVEDGTIQWLRGLMEQDKSRDVRLVLLVFPAGPTREAHLLALKMLQAGVTDEKRKLEIRVLPTRRLVSPDCEKTVLPPTNLLAHDSQADKTWFCLGSVGDAGQDAARLASFNAVFQPDAAFCDQWRRWFQYLFGCAAPLTAETVRIPALVPAKGDPAAEALWAEFQQTCWGADAETTRHPVVDPKTGEVTVEADGSPTQPWDGGKIQLDPLAQHLQQVYAHGWLATVDETTRIKPLAIPVRATLLGEQAERAVGAVTQRQSFNLAVLDADVAKEVEKCRSVADILELLTYQLSKGNRWIPNATKPLLDRELKARNKQGMARLREAFKGKGKAQDAPERELLPDAPSTADGGNAVKEYVRNRREALKHDLDAMYRELRRGDAVPPEKLEEVLANVEARLTAALDARITPRLCFNRLTPEDLTNTAPDEHWAQPLSLLLQSARLFRRCLTDAFFSRNFTKRSFTQQEFETAMNVFGDTILQTGDAIRAKAELETLDEIEQSDQTNKAKCHAIWQLLTAGEQQS